MSTTLRGTTKLPGGQTLTLEINVNVPPGVTNDDVVDTLLDIAASYASSNHKIHTMMNKSFEEDFRDNVAEIAHKHKLRNAKAMWFAVGVWTAVLLQLGLNWLAR